MARVSIGARKDLTGRQWQILEPLLPSGKRPGRPPRWGRDQAENRRKKGSRGGRSPVFDPDRYRDRPAVECGINLLKQHRGVATRYDKLLVRYEASVQVAAIDIGYADWPTPLPKQLPDAYDRMIGLNLGGRPLAG